MNDLFLRACRGESIERPPIWILRQAGRYLPEYRAVRETVDFLTLCRTPELAAKVTLQPIDRFGFDAAILFSDILVPAAALGIEFDFDPAPTIARPIRERADVARLSRTPPEEAVPYVFETVRIVRRELAGRVPLIGFAAAPLTLAVYLVEGGGSKDHARIKSLLWSDPSTAHELLERLADLTALYLAAQVEAGVQAVQLFDSWAGILDPQTYREFGLRWTTRVLEALAATGVPRIYFALDASHLLPEIRRCPAEVFGCDWRLPLDAVSHALDGRFVLQGNLDPCSLLAPDDVVERRAAEVLEQARGLARGHVFNLGHGILPQTPIASVARLVETVRAHRRSV
jgi:uroporphyrinogen decarboxylase